MEMLCPECMGTMVMIDANTAKCTIHGGEYQVLFSREGLSVPKYSAPPFVQRSLPSQNVKEPPQPAQPENPMDGFILTQCSHCQKQFRIKPQYVGRKLKCPNCQQEFIVGGEEPQEEKWKFSVQPSNPQPTLGSSHSQPSGFTHEPVQQKWDLISEPPKPSQGLTDQPSPAFSSEPIQQKLDFIEEPAFSKFTKKCYNHPTVIAQYSCKFCGSYLCGTCDFLQQDGSHVCPNCISKKGSRSSFVHNSTPNLSGAMCSIHPTVQAVQRCKVCRAPICSTCDFVFSGVHFCPECASKPRQGGIGKKRTSSIIWGYVLAIFSTLGIFGSIVLAIDIHSRSDLEALSITLAFFGFIASIIGTALSISCFEKRLANPPSLWVVTIWNGIITVGFVLLGIIGRLGGG